MSALPQEIRIAIGVFIILGGVAGVGWIIWRSLKASEDAARLLFRLCITAFLFCGGGYAIYSIAGDGSAAGQIAAIILAAVLGLFLAILWVPTIVSKVGDAFGSLYTGGRSPPTPTPAYSVAEARRKQGRIAEALVELQKELAKFPTDVTGQMMLAEVLAENVGDLDAAAVTIERFLTQDHAPRNVAFALNSLADWRLKLAKDVEGAREALHRIGELLPDSEEAQNAAQRIAHLPTVDELLRRETAGVIAMPQGMRDVGLRTNASLSVKTDEDPEEAAARLCAHLGDHPLDRDAREKLALLYADHFQDLDAAIQQFEQLAQLPNQSPRDVAKWLNRVADLQVRQGADYEAIRMTLQRIIDQFSGLAPAQLAQQRIEIVRLELKGKEKGQTVQMGDYEQNMGLRVSRPPNPNAEV